MRMNRFYWLIVWLSTVLVAADGYKIEQQIGEGELGSVTQLAIGAGNRICALDRSGKITLFNPDGSLASSIETGMANTEAFAVDADGNFHVFSTRTEEKKIKVGARLRKVQVPIGVECGIFDPAGNKLKTVELKNLKSAKAAKIVNGKLVVADLTERALVFMDLDSAVETARVKKGLRLCCGIFDFCEAPEQSVAVSNLGAFKLQRYDLDGNRVSEFGKRGRGLDDFQGCCNPVSAGYLPDGQILTVEKDPTRIKIYDTAGKNAKQIDGVEELVKGCSFIPVAVDREGSIYLAAPAKGYIVKCIP